MEGSGREIGMGEEFVAEALLQTMCPCTETMDCSSTCMAWNAPLQLPRSQREQRR